MSSPKNKQSNQGLGVAQLGNKATLFYRQGNKQRINIAILKKGQKEFKRTKQKLKLPQQTSELRISQVKRNTFYLTTVIPKNYLNQLKGTRLKKNFKLNQLNKIDGLMNLGMIVPKFKHGKQRVIYTGGKEIKIGYSKDLKKWQIKHQAVFQPKEEILGRS